MDIREDGLAAEQAVTNVRQDEINNGESSGAIGADGYLTLLLSNLVLLLSGGLYWCWLLGHVFRVAKNTGTGPLQCDVITVLGMRLDNNVVRPEFAQRLLRAKSLFEAGVARKILVIGGITGDNEISEAQGGKDYLVQRGIEADCILLEDRSRHTLENLSNVRAQYLSGNGLREADFQKDNLQENRSQKNTRSPESILQISANESGDRKSSSVPGITVITNRFHLARCHIMADTFCISHTLSAAEDKFEMDFRNLLRLLLEAYFIHWYKVGKAWSRMTRNRKSLERIS